MAGVSIEEVLEYAEYQSFWVCGLKYISCFFWVPQRK
jgi:hypothetical protein